MGGAYTGCGRPYEGIRFGGLSDGIHLEAIAGSRKHGAARRVEINEWRRRDGRRAVEVLAFLIEKQEGMVTGRGAIVQAGPGAFRRNLKSGTATLRPPGPFTGWARLAPGPGGKGTWTRTGSLKVPVLGGESLELTGPDFRAHLFKREEIDE